MTANSSAISAAASVAACPVSPSCDPSLPHPLRWDDLAPRLPARREWVMEGWIPAAQTTLLSGRGGEGKTAIAQHIATCVALGRPYIDAILTPGPVLMWAGEDDAAELWRRQIPICSWLDSTISDLTSRLYLYSWADHDMSLATPAFGVLQPTRLMTLLREQVGDLKPRLVILDNVSRIFGGQEQDRHQVMSFCAWLRAACSPAALLLLGHTAKPTESEYSGSTAWENAVRARLLFGSKAPADMQPDEDDDPGAARYLSRRKLNAPGGRVTHLLEWQDDVLVPIERVTAGAPSKAGRKTKPVETRRALI
jgi:RecA-family ATPase